MTVTASLVPGGIPQLVQIVVDEIPDGAPWEIFGVIGEYTPGLAPGLDVLPGEGTVPSDSVFTDGSYTWRVPGGFGVGDGGQVVLVDNRAPGNVPVIYRVVVGSAVEASEPVLVVFEKDLVLQTLDGQQSIQADLLDGSLSIDLATSVAKFRVPGRARPVTRYDVIGDVAGSFEVLLPISETTPFRSLLADGAPVVCRFGTEVADLERVSVVQLLRIQSPDAYPVQGVRLWSLQYEIVDDPFADVRLGAFTWVDGFDAAFEGRPWSDLDEAFTGLEWDAFDTADWGSV
jgi:hypothetical protein